MTDSYNQRLLDEFACRRLVETYWHAENVRDADRLTSLFTDDGIWGPSVGREAIAANAEKMVIGLKTIAKNPVSFGGFDVQIDGDQATGSAHGIAHLIIPQDGGEPKVVVVDAIYDLTFRKVEGEWKISWMRGFAGPTTHHDTSFQYVPETTAIDFGLPQGQIVFERPDELTG